MRKMIAAVWDMKPGRFHQGRTRGQRESLLKMGYTPAEAAQYAKAMSFSIGPGLKKRIKEAIN